MKLIGLELFKMSRRLRTYLGFAALGAIVAAMLVGLKYGPPPVERLTASMGRDFEMVGSFINGGFAAWLVLQATVVSFMPLFACLVPGDLVSGESSDGTLRMLLARSVNRGPVLAAKYAASAIYVAALMVFLGLAAYGFGVLVFGHGGLLVVDNGFASFPEREGLMRLAGSYGLASVSMLTIATIAFFLSTLVSNSTGAIIGAMAVTFVSAALGGIDYFKPIWPYLFTTHTDVWKTAFATPHVDWSGMGLSLRYHGANIAVFLAASAIAFRRKDVLA